MFCLNLPVKIPYAVVVSVLSGVSGCGCPISINVCHIEITSCAFINNPATSASAANANANANAIVHSTIFASI